MLKLCDEISGVDYKYIVSVESEHMCCHIASFKPLVMGGLVFKSCVLESYTLRK